MPQVDCVAGVLTSARAWVLMVASLSSPTWSMAQHYAAKPIRFVVPHTVAGSPDILARFLGIRLGDTLGQQVIVDNLAGAAGIVGAERVARAVPDGYTLFVGSSAVVINPNLYKKVGYDVLRDFQPITALALAPLVLVVHPSLPARSVRELIALMKASPGAINYASGGSGSAAHMAAELFKVMAGVDIVHVPYKGTAPALIDLAGGQVPVGFYTLSATSGHVKTGRLRALGISALKRSPAIPELPTLAEAGLPGYEASTWIGVLAPAGTPREIVERLHAEIAKILTLPDVQQAFAVQGFDMIANTPTEFAAQIKGDLIKWARVIKTAKLTVD